MNQGNLATVEADEIFKRYLADEKIADIAQSFNVSRSGLNYHLLHHHKERWVEIQAVRALTALEHAKEAMDLADDILSLSRAREQLKAAQWDLERLCRRIYGQNVDLTSKGEQLEAMDAPTMARRVAFLLRKGTEEGEPEDAEIVAETPMLQRDSTVRQDGEA